MRLDTYTTGSYTTGASLCRQLLWYFVGSPLVSTPWLPMASLKIWTPRRFGAQIGQGVNIKPGVMSSGDVALKAVGEASLQHIQNYSPEHFA